MRSLHIAMSASKENWTVKLKLENESTGKLMTGTSNQIVTSNVINCRHGRDIANVSTEIQATTPLFQSFPPLFFLG